MKQLGCIATVLLLLTGCRLVPQPDLNVTVLGADFYYYDAYFSIVLKFQNDGDGDAENINYNLQIFYDDIELGIYDGADTVPSVVSAGETVSPIFIAGYSIYGWDYVITDSYRLTIDHRNPRGKSMTPIVIEGQFTDSWPGL